MLETEESVWQRDPEIFDDEVEVQTAC